MNPEQRAADGPDASLRNLEGTGSEPKSLSPEDRAAINEALMDQTNIAIMTEAGRSSQRERERKRREARQLNNQSKC